MQLYNFRLKQTLSVEIEDVPRDAHGRQQRVPGSKGIQFVHLDRDSSNAWRGWEFEATDRGIMIQPPAKCDMLLVPWSEVDFAKFRPAAKAEKKVVK